MSIPSPLSKNEECKNMSRDYPSFRKILFKSHISDGFCMGLPLEFCRAHLPGDDETVILVDENELEYRMKYSVQRARLVDGWKGFSIGHNLMEGDILAFHLIEPCKFKVYITRSRKTREKERADSNAIPIVKQEVPDSPAVEEHEGKKKARLLLETGAKGPSADDRNHLGSNILEAIRDLKSAVSFNEVKSLDQFQIQVDGELLDAKIPAHLRKKYYELCASQKMCLHHGLVRGLGIKVAVVVISETTEIADAIRAADLATSVNQLESWEKTLKAFQVLGMEVGFLCTRLHKLVRLLQESEDALEYKRKCALFDEQRRALQEEILKVDALIQRAVAFRASMEGLASDVDTLGKKNEKLGLVFKEIAGSPW